MLFRLILHLLLLMGCNSMDSLENVAGRSKNPTSWLEISSSLAATRSNEARNGIEYLMEESTLVDPDRSLLDGHLDSLHLSKQSNSPNIELRNRVSGKIQSIFNSKPFSPETNSKQIVQQGISCDAESCKKHVNYRKAQDKLNTSNPNFHTLNYKAGSIDSIFGAGSDKQADFKDFQYEKLELQTLENLRSIKKSLIHLFILFHILIGIMCFVLIHNI